ncbi:MAG TPA: YceI family protein [Saprospiraceae bacterium]|nr:YceI family protein [Saprospiraceae bacterium]
MRKFLFIALTVFIAAPIFGQRYFSKNAVIKFHSDSPIEKIDAVNTSASTVMDLASGKIEFAALNNAFIFEKALMQEHFNENYMESTKFPKTVFKGAIDDVSKLNLSTPGIYKVKVSGELNMHGVTRTVSAPAEFVVDAKGVHATSSFMVKCSDYNIEIPAVVKKNVSNDVSISIKVDYTPLK